MKHVFVETGWVVDFCAPPHRVFPAASELAAAAAKQEITLYLPSICITEARYVVRQRYQAREVTPIRDFLRWSRAAGDLAAEPAEAARKVVDQYEQTVNKHLDGIEDLLRLIPAMPGVEVFALSDLMLDRSLALASELDLKPFDMSILAAVLVRSGALYKSGERDLCFAEQDGDLQPWDKAGNSKPLLARLYDEAHVWVYRDFTLTTPEPYAGWVNEDVPSSQN